MAYVALDYGHGKNTFPPSKGVYRNGKAYHEHEFNADVGEQVRKILERHGVKVLVTQPPNKNDVGLKYRTDLANKKKVDLFVSFHANAGVSTAKGACVFAWKGFPGANRAADLVVKHLKAQKIDLHGNGRHYSELNSWTNLHVLRETDMDAILIEHGFMTNDRDFENIFGKNSKDYRKRCAIADAKGILEFFGIKYKDDTPKPKPQPKEEDEMLEKAIVIHSFADFPNAEILANKLNAPIYMRNTATKQEVAKEVIVVGGSKNGIKGRVTLLSGGDRFETAAEVKKYLK